MSLKISLLFTIFLINFKEKKKSLQRTYTLTIQYLYIDQILFNNSSASPQKYSLKFFFLPLFLKSSKLILKYFTQLLFLIWLGNLSQKYITILSKNPISSFWNL